MSKIYGRLRNEMDDYTEGIDKMKRSILIINDRAQRKDYTTAKRLIDEEFETRFDICTNLQENKRQIGNYNLNKEEYIDSIYNLNLAIDHSVNILNGLMKMGFALDNMNYLRQNTQEMII